MGGVPDEKYIQGEVSNGVKGQRVSGKESWRAGVAGGRPGGEMSRPQEVRKRAAGEQVHWERRDEEAGHWG